MPEPGRNTDSIFFAALDLVSSDQRSAYLDRACAGDSRLRTEVEELLRAYPKVERFLEQPAPGVAVTIEQSVAECPGTVVGPYKLLEQIGEGGMGTVYVAEQKRPVRRTVALKVIKPGMDTREVIARFEAERQALAMMNHPSIAKVLDAGATAAGRPYFVMELVKGTPITEFCDQHKLETRERLQLFVTLCQAVQHAHQKGLIHRDLKPSNVLIELHDVTPVPKVIDFGVAKAIGRQLTEATLHTGFSQMVGTPLYMSPEQAGQSSLDVDTRSDIYSLGVLLYELLTGTTPFDKETFSKVGYDEMRRMIREDVPPCPSQRFSTLAAKAHPTVSQKRAVPDRQRTGALRGELDWIVMKALEKDRSRRYDTPAALAADIQHYLNDEPVEACPPSAWYRFRKFARRNKAALATASLAGLAVVVLATSLVLIAIEKQARQTAEQGRALAEDDRKNAFERERRESYFHLITLAHRDLALERLAECPEDLRGWEWHYLMRLCKVDPLVIRDRGDKTEFYGMAFSPDGEQLASADGDGIVTIWDSRTGKVIKSFPAHTGRVLSVVFHRDGKHLASRGADKTVKVWDLTTTDQAVFTELCDWISIGACTVAFSSDGRLLAWGSDKVVKVYDWKRREFLRPLPGHDFHTIPVAFSSDGRLATATFREGVKVWDAQTGKLLRPIDHDVPVGALAFTPDGKWLASASRRGPVLLWDSTTGAVRKPFDSHTGNVECVAFSPDGRYLASGGEDKTVRVWDAATGREILGLNGHTDKCWCVAFSPDGRRLASASSDGTIRIWDATPLKGNEGQEIRTLDHGDEVRTVAFSPDGLSIASGGDGYLAKVWDAQTGDSTAEFRDHEDPKGGNVPVFCLAWHPDGHRIASSSVDTVRVWDARTGVQDFSLACKSQNPVAFSPDGRYLVTGDGTGAVQVWDGKTGEELGTLDIHRQSIGGLVFSRDGDLLASAGRDGTVKVWDAKRLDKQDLDGKPKPRIPPIQARVPGPGVNIAFSPDGRRLATGGEKNTVIIWDVQTGDEILPLWGEHSGEVYAVAFSPLDDGRLIATAGEDSAVKIWDSHSGTLIRSFRGHTALVSSLSFSPDGCRLVSGSRDKTVKIWDMTQLSEVREP